MASHGFNNGRLTLHNSNTDWWINYNDDTFDIYDFIDSGSPEGVVTAERSSTYRDRDTGEMYTKTTDSGNTGWSRFASGAGDVEGPASSTDNAIARFNGTDGKEIQNSGVIISDTNVMTGGTWQGTAIGTSYGGTGQSTTATSGTILRGDGTNWGATTATYPATTTANQLLYSSATNTIAGLATGNDGALITSAAGVPSISSTLPSVVQGNITSTGTIASGVWNGTAVGTQYGGTGQNFSASTGLVSLSAGTASATLTPSVTSITLSSGTALSSYVEGNWTPAMSFGGDETGFTYSTRSGYYTRIGRLVFCSFRMQLTAAGSGTGNIAIINLPISTALPTNTGTMVYYSNVTLPVNYTNLVGSINGTSFGFVVTGSGQAVVNGTTTNVTVENNAYFQGEFYYVV